MPACRHEADEAVSVLDRRALLSAGALYGERGRMTASHDQERLGSACFSQGRLWCVDRGIFTAVRAAVHCDKTSVLLYDTANMTRHHPPAAVTAAVAPMAASAEEGADGFSKAPSGLEWKDVREGTGPSPISGALIRYGA